MGAVGRAWREGVPDSRNWEVTEGRHGDWSWKEERMGSTSRRGWPTVVAVAMAGMIGGCGRADPAGATGIQAGHQPPGAGWVPTCGDCMVEDALDAMRRDLRREQPRMLACGGGGEPVDSASWRPVDRHAEEDPAVRVASC
jgi:hypothetical protein